MCKIAEKHVHGSKRLFCTYNFKEWMWVTIIGNTQYFFIIRDTKYNAKLSQNIHTVTFAIHNEIGKFRNFYKFPIIYMIFVLTRPCFPERDVFALYK